MKVTFYKTETNSKGDKVEYKITSFTFNYRLSEEEAIGKSIDKLKEQMIIPDWKDVADYYKIT